MTDNELIILYSKAQQDELDYLTRYKVATARLTPVDLAHFEFCRYIVELITVIKLSRLLIDDTWPGSQIWAGRLLFDYWRLNQKHEKVWN